MNKAKWLKQLEKKLAPLGKSERNEALDYYKEIFSDKFELGMSEQDIIKELGTPKECADKILSESVAINSSKQQDDITLKSGVGTLVKIICLVPACIVLFCVMVTMVAVSISGLVVTLAGVFYFFVALTSTSILTTEGLIYQLGVGVTACGVGLIMFASFKYISKYAVGTFLKFFNSIRRRGAE